VNELDERRVIEALQALTGGLTVTEQDIIDADGRFRDRLEPPSPRRRLPFLVAAAAALVLLVGYVAFHVIGRDGNAAPPVNQPHSPADVLRTALQADAYTLPAAQFEAGEPPTSRDVAGFWLLRAPYGFSIFVDGDGRWMAGSPSRPDGYGTSTLADGRWKLRMNARSGWARCIADAHATGTTGISQSRNVALARDGSLRAQLAGTMPPCTPAENREVWDRVDPGSPIADYLLATAKQAEWQAAPEDVGLKGFYVSPKTGHFLEVDKAGRYRYYDTRAGALPVTADRGKLEPATGTVTGSCAGGHFSGNLETARIRGVEGYVVPYDAIRITSTGDGCAPIAAHDVWVNLYS
jgi:hypothetical protein